MIAIVLYSLVFIFGLIFTLSTIPPIKKLLKPFFQSFHHHQNPLDLNYDQLPKTTTSKAHELREVFSTFDKNGDGCITKHELSESLKSIGISAGDRDVVEMVERVDSNGDGHIDFNEFCQLFDEEEEGDLKEAFDVFDGNKDGLITVDELGLVLSSLGFSEGKKIEDCKEMIRKVDMDGDGMVNFEEFKTMMKAGPTNQNMSFSFCNQNKIWF